MRAHQACSEGKHRSNGKKKALGRRQNQTLASTVCLEAQTFSSSRLLRARRAHQKTLPKSSFPQNSSTLACCLCTMINKASAAGGGTGCEFDRLAVNMFPRADDSQTQLPPPRGRRINRHASKKPLGFHLFAKHFSTLYMFMRYFPRRGSWRRPVMLFIWNTYTFLMTNIGCERSLTSHYAPNPRPEVNHRLWVFAIPTRVWEFALNIHAYVSYLAATTSFSPSVAPTRRTSKEKKEESKRVTTQSRLIELKHYPDKSQR